MSLNKILLTANSNNVGGDPYWNNVVLLLKADGSNGSSTIIDSTGKNTISVVGATISTTTSVTNGSSLYFNGSSRIVLPASSNWDFGSGDFTIEFWLRQDPQPSGWSWSGVPMTTWHIGGANSGNGWTIGASNNGVYDINFGGMLNSTSSYNTTGIALTQNTWMHYAIVRSGSTLMQFKNGVLANTYNYGTGAIYYPSTELWLGMWSTGYGGMIGYMDEIRITKGIARYTSNFTPSIQSFPTSQGSVNSNDPYWNSVSLLLKGDGNNGSQSFVDSSKNNNTITANGNAQINVTTKKFGTGSMYFDGVKDYLTIASNDLFVFGSNDFTIELWAKFTGYPYLDGGGTYSSDIIAKDQQTTSNFREWALYYAGTSTSITSIGFSINNGTFSGWVTAAGQGTYNLNQWYHLAAVRNASSLLFFIDGTLVQTTPCTIAVQNTPAWVIIGGLMWSVTNGAIWQYDYTTTGYIDDLRVTKGVARYTANFTPPTQSFPTQ